MKMNRVSVFGSVKREEWIRIRKFNIRFMFILILKPILIYIYTSKNPQMYIMSNSYGIRFHLRTSTKSNNQRGNEQQTTNQPTSKHQK